MHNDMLLLLLSLKAVDIYHFIYGSFNHLFDPAQVPQIQNCNYANGDMEWPVKVFVIFHDGLHIGPYDWFPLQFMG